MTGFNHTLAGALVAVIVPPPVAPLAAFLSHYAMDGLPHFGRDPRFIPYNRAFIRLLMVDALLCVSALLYALILFPDKWWLLIVCTAAATLPDFLWAVREKAPGWLRLQYALHHRIQWGERPYGWVFEGMFTVAAAYGLWLLTK